jgi:hypothetical protein
MEKGQNSKYGATGRKTMKGKANDRQYIEKGIVVPVAWNSHGQVTTVAIAAQGESEYIVDGDKAGREMLNLVTKMVTVTGRVRSGKDGKNRITIEKYKLVS